MSLKARVQSSTTAVHDPLALDKCCSIVIEQLLRGLHDFLRDKGVSFYIMFGTLLGAHRDGAIIPWTSDLDVVVEAEFTHILERIHEWNETFYFWMENRHIGRMCIIDNDDENAKTWGAWDKIPTYVTYTCGNTSRKTRDHRRRKQSFQSYRDAFSILRIFMVLNLFKTALLVNCAFATSMSTPARTVAILNHTYTSKWMNPDETRSPHGSGQCPNDDQLYYNKLVSLAK